MCNRRHCTVIAGSRNNQGNGLRAGILITSPCLILRAASQSRCLIVNNRNRNAAYGSIARTVLCPERHCRCTYREINTHKAAIVTDSDVVGGALCFGHCTAAGINPLRFGNGFAEEAELRTSIKRIGCTANVVVNIRVERIVCCSNNRRCSVEHGDTLYLAGSSIAAAV